jgi:hypothetical protein
VAAASGHSPCVAVAASELDSGGVESPRGGRDDAEGS